jgi:glycosyltransferase involved in cell wall biosynthesis
MGFKPANKTTASTLAWQLKFLLISGIYPPDIGGPATFIPAFGAFLRDSGADVEVITLSPNGNEVLQEDFGKVIKIRRAKLKLIRFIEVTWQIYTRSRNAEIIFANGLYEEAAVANLIRRKKLVFKIVGDPIWERFRNSSNSSYNFNEYHFSQLSTKLKLERFLFNWSLRRANIITSPGSKLARTIENIYGVKNIQVIENGIDPPSYSETIEFNYDLISVSRLVKWKRIDLLIRAAARTKSTLLVIGEGPEEYELKRLANQINAQIHFMGSVSKKEILMYLQQSRIFALVSSYEGLSFSLLEALSIGKRILVSDIDANQILFEGTNFASIVDPEKPEEIDAAIKLLISDSRQNHEKQKAARVFVNQRFNSKLQLKKMQQLTLSTLEPE